jgi:hypothetical protein
VYRIHFLYSSHLIFWTLEWLHGLAIVNSATINMVCRYLYCMPNNISLEVCPRITKQNHMVVLLLVFWRLSILISIVTAQIYISTNSV